MGKDPKFIVAALLAIVFTAALTFATVEIPRLLNSAFMGVFPDLDPLGEFEAIEEFMNHARPIGYASLAIVVGLIILSFVGKGKLSSLGPVALFLPTFGYFAFSMFFLAGIGVLRVLWFPLWDLSQQLMKLGDIVYLPFTALMYSFSLAGLDMMIPFYITIGAGILAVAAGILVFLLGVITWLYGKFKGLGMLDFWIYRYSRHPQYLGFLLWSYGVMLLASLAPSPRGGYKPGPSLIWLISALIVICIALREEVNMVKKHGGEYLTYRRRSPFMVPLPKFISAMATAPIRILFKKSLPETGKELACTFLVYTAIFTILSLPFYLLNRPPN